MRALIGGSVNDATNMETRGGVLLEVEVDTYISYYYKIIKNITVS